MADEAVDERYCSNGTACVAYPSLGEPAKLSQGNPNSICFACEKQLADAVALETPIPEEKAKRKPTERNERFLVRRKARLRAKRQPRGKGRPREGPYPAELVNLELAAKRRGHTLYPWYQRADLDCLVRPLWSPRLGHTTGIRAVAPRRAIAFEAVRAATTPRRPLGNPL